MKRILLLAICLCMACVAFAQTQKGSQRFCGSFDWDFMGDYTFNGIKQENGENIFDGPFQMSAKIDQNFNNYKNRYNATLKGSYLLKGSHSKGKLHGPMSLDATLNLSASNGDRANYKYTFRGNFKNGLPDGNFVVDYPSYNIKVNVNYKDGILVGAYSVKGRDEKYCFFSISGTLTSTGLPTGTWKFDTSTVYEKTFSNGVVVNQYDYDPDLCVKAKDFASGKISEEELMKENICVRVGNMALASKASMQIYHKGIDWDRLGLRRFNLSDTINYRYLDRLSTLSEEGLNKYKEGIVKAVRTGERDPYSFVRQAYYSANKLPENIEEDSNMHYFTINSVELNELKPYVIGYPDWSDGVVRVYFTPEQVDEIKQVIEEARLECIDSIPIDKLSISSIKYTDFKPLDSDSNIMVYTNNDYIHYVSIGAYEDYFVQEGLGAEILNMSTDERRDILAAKKKEFDDKLAGRALELIDSFFYMDYWNSLFKESERLGYQVHEIKTPSSNHYELSATVKIADNTNYDDGYVKYKSYKFNIYFEYKHDYYGGEKQVQIDSNKTFMSSNFTRVRNEFDVIDDLGITININNCKVKSEAEDAYQVIELYQNSLDFTITDDNLQSAIDVRENFIAYQNEVIKFVDLRKQLDEEIAQNSIKIKTLSIDLYELYILYQNSIDFRIKDNILQSAIESREKFILFQNDVFKFIELRNTIDNNHVNITSLKSSASAIYKAYNTYYSKCNLVWNPNVDFEKINALIDIQNRYLEVIKLPNIADINKSVKKNKVTDIEVILNSLK